MTKKVTVLGASGNIGKLLVNALNKDNYTIKASGRLQPTFVLQNVTNILVDFTDTKSIYQSMRDSSFTFVTIGLEYSTKVWQQEWVPLIEKIIDAAIESKTKLVFFDNVYAYGLVPGNMTETTPHNPNSKKGIVRAQIDTLLTDAIKHRGLTAVIATSADFYGPNLETSIIGDRFFDQMLNKQTFEWLGDNTKKHSFTFVEDIIPALIALAESPDTSGQKYHLPTASPALIGLEVQKIFEDLLDTPLKTNVMKRPMTYLLQLFAPILKEVREMMYQNEHDYVFDSSKILKEFPILKATDYTTGFHKTLEWYKSHQK